MATAPTALPAGISVNDVNLGTWRTSILEVQSKGILATAVSTTGWTSTSTSPTTITGLTGATFTLATARYAQPVARIALQTTVAADGFRFQGGWQNTSDIYIQDQFVSGAYPKNLTLVGAMTAYSAGTYGPTFSVLRVTGTGTITVTAVSIWLEDCGPV